MTVKQEVLDASDFGGGGFKQAVRGLNSIEGSCYIADNPGRDIVGQLFRVNANGIEFDAFAESLQPTVNGLAKVTFVSTGAPVQEAPIRTVLNEIREGRL